MSKDKKEYTQIYKQVGANIRQKRILANLSQEELAFRISSARNYVGCIERGEKFPSVATLYEIAKALNSKFSDLFINIE